MIYVDGQVFQTQTWNRGMGKYSFELLKSIASNKDFNDNVVIIFSSLFDIEEDRVALLRLAIPEVETRLLPLKRTNLINYDEIHKNNKKVLDENIEPGAVFLIPSIFEGEVVGVFPTESKKMAIFYDLIPHLFYDTYLRNNEIARDNYYNRYTTLFEADTLFAISETSRNDAILYLGIDEKKVVNINGASIAITQETHKPKDSTESKFIISPSGDDNRKNNKRMAEGFRLFNQRNGNCYKLIITSNFREEVRKGILAVSRDIIFVGNVPEPELRWYYENAEALLFVPEYEGLGLPVLEAVRSKIPIVCSRIGVFEEMNKGVGFNFVDHESPESIASGLEDAVSKNKKYDKASYEIIANKYTWDKSASMFLSTYYKVKKSQLKSQDAKTKVAIVCPMPGGKSAIGKLVEICHVAMSKKYDLSYFFEIPEEDVDDARMSYLHNIADVKSVKQFTIKESQNYEKIIYHLGSSTYHLQTILSELAIPGIAVIHDTDFEEVFRCLQSNMYINEDRYQAEKDLGDLSGSQDRAKFLTSITAAAKKMIAHSVYTQQTVEGLLIGDKKENGIVQASFLPIGVNTLMLPRFNERIIVAIAGIIHSNKGLGVLARLLEDERFNNVDFRVFGYDYAVEDPMVDEIRMHPNVTIVVNLSDLKYREENQKADILLNYRSYYHGETSYSTLEAMREGVVPIVRNVGWFSEIDNAACLKVESEEEAIEKLAEIIKDTDKLTKKSLAAFDFARKFSPSKYVDVL